MQRERHRAAAQSRRSFLTVFQSEKRSLKRGAHAARVRIRAARPNQRRVREFVEHSDQIVRGHLFGEPPKSARQRRALLIRGKRVAPTSFFGLNPLLRKDDIAARRSVAFVIGMIGIMLCKLAKAKPQSWWPGLSESRRPIRKRAGRWRTQAEAFSLSAGLLTRPRDRTQFVAGDFSLWRGAVRRSRNQRSAEFIPLQPRLCDDSGNRRRHSSFARRSGINSALQNLRRTR